MSLRATVNNKSNLGDRARKSNNKDAPRDIAYDDLARKTDWQFRHQCRPDLGCIHWYQQRNPIQGYLYQPALYPRTSPVDRHLSADMAACYIPEVGRG